MSDLNRHSMTLDPAKRRSRLADLGDRMARTFGTAERMRAPEPPNWEPATEPEDLDDTVADWEGMVPRFRITRRGYDCVDVDEYVADLERELDDLRTRPRNGRSVEDEIDRLGEQTAAILRVAHEQAREITRSAQSQAHTCLAEAAADATNMKESAQRQLRQLDVETDSVWRERTRLIDDVRQVAEALLGLADDAAERFPAEPARGEQPVMAAPPRAAPPPAAPVMAAPPPAPAPATVEHVEPLDQAVREPPDDPA